MLLVNLLLLLAGIASSTDITSFGFETQDVEHAGSTSKYEVTLLWDGEMLTCNVDIKPTTRNTWYYCTDFTVCSNPSQDERTIVINNYNEERDFLSIDRIAVISSDVTVGDQGLAAGRREWDSFCSPDSNLIFNKGTEEVSGCTATNWDQQDKWNIVCMDDDDCLGSATGSGGAENTWPKLQLSLSMISEAGIITNRESDLNCYDLCLVDETSTYPTKCSSSSDCNDEIGERCNDRSIDDGSWEELQDNDGCDNECECYCISPQILSFGYQVSNNDANAVSADQFKVTLFWDGRNYECDTSLDGKTQNSWHDCNSFTVCQDDSGSFKDRRMFIEKPDGSTDGLWIETIRITDDVHGAIEYGTFCSDINNAIDPRYFSKQNEQCSNGDDRWNGICMDEAQCLGTDHGSGGAEKTYPIMELDLNRFGGAAREVQIILTPDTSYQQTCTYAVMDCENEDNDFINDWRESIDWVQNDWFISGIYSEHNNNQEDRQWKGRYCRQSTDPFISTSTLTRTGEDQTWDMQCDDNSALIGFVSQYNSGARDRWFEIKCGALDTTQYVLTECVSSNGDYVNDWDAIVDFECPDNGIITGIRSTHDNDREDRRYGFKCCRVTFTKCSADDVGTFNWDKLLKDGTEKPAMSYDIDIDEENLALDIEVKLRYLGKTSAAGNGALYGTTYVLDFEDFNAHNDEIDKPGTCQNRDESAFNGLNFEEYWKYSPEPLTAGNLGSVNTLAYPPPKPVSGDWDISMDTDDGCGTVVYRGKFTWNDLKGCTSNGGGGNSYVTTSTNTNDDTLELRGTFYINVVSPYSHSTNMGGYYRVYQLLSAPFVISVAKTVYVLDSTGINLLRMSIIAVYKEDNENTFRLIVLSESANYLQLSRSNDLLSDFQSSSGNTQLTSGSFQALQISASVDYKDGEIAGCLNDKSNICSQLWEIKAENVNCDGHTEFVDFSGVYSIQFDVACRAQQTGVTQQLSEYCDKWLNGDPNDLENYPQHKTSITDQNGFILLQTELTWKDEVCDPQIFEVHFNAEIMFYTDNQFDDNNNAAAPNNYLYQVGQDTIYVEIVTNFPGHFDVFDTILQNVWICTFDPLLTPDPISPDTATGGCFDTDQDNTDFDGHIYKIGPPQEKLFDFDNIGHPDNSDSSKNQIRFSFSVPSTVTRDKLYVHAQIEVTLSNGNRRRMLLNIDGSSTANQIDHFIGNIGIGNKPNNKDNEPIYNEPQQPILYPNPSSPSTTTWTFSLSSSWIIIIGGLLGLILTFNIIFMCYTNCYKNTARGGRVIFDNRLSRRGKKEYSSVKINDSEYDDSEVNAINA